MQSLEGMPELQLVLISELDLRLLQLSNLELPLRRSLQPSFLCEEEYLRVKVFQGECIPPLLKLLKFGAAEA